MSSQSLFQGQSQTFIIIPMVDGVYDSFVFFFFQNEPYTMLRENPEALSGNDRFEGYNVDLISEVANILGFNYTINIVADGNYGSYNDKNKTWNGMIGELLSQKADLAVADLTITYERETGVDFTMPFMNLGEFLH